MPILHNSPIAYPMPCIYNSNYGIFARFRIIDTHERFLKIVLAMFIGSDIIVPMIKDNFSM
jgi:hypothetical protein